MAQATTTPPRTVARSRTRSGRLSDMLSHSPVHIALVVIAVFWLVPSLGLFVTSWRPSDDIASSGWWHAIVNWDFTLHNYGSVLHGQGMATGLRNSLAIAVPATVLPLFIGALAAYAFSWMRFPLRDTVFLGIVALMIVPIQMAFVPALKLFRHVDVLGFQGTTSLIGIWVAHTAFALPFCIFLLRNFFITLPVSLIEAARIDGASSWSIFRRLVLPLSVPALASFAIFQFLWVWNDLLMALIFIQNPSLQPLTVRLANLQSTYGTQWDLLSAGAFLLMIVPLVVFFSLQRYFVQGLLAGSVKS